MKALLIPFEESEIIESVFASAVLTAKRFASYVEGVYVQPALPAIASADGFGVVTPAFVEKYEREDKARVQQAQDFFESYMQKNGISGTNTDGQPYAVWQNVGPTDDYVGHRGRLFDLVVVGRPMQGATTPTMHTLEAALFESGRPILIAPPRTPTVMGEMISIAWNGSTETARTIAFAKPFLLKAKKVVVVTVAEACVPGPSGSDVARYLAHNDIDASVVDASAAGRNPGQAMLEESIAQGADLMIKGAYTNSRLRQMIFGGATNFILSNTEIPVFMSH
jgi:nucleotide-binding universal stress UspA family protein